jgi:hypothetical protein
MPVQLAADDTIRASLFGVLHGQIVIMTFHYRYRLPSGGGPGPEIDTYFISVESQVVAHTVAALVNFQATEMVWYNIRLKRVFPEPSYFLDFPIVGLAGTIDDSPSVPSTCAVVITRRTSTAGRTGLGRVFMPGLASALETSSLLNLTTANAMQTAVGTAWLGDIPNALGNLTAGLEHKPPIGITDNRQLRALQVQRVLRVQRRREVGVGI